MSHEIRTPMNAVLALTQSLAKSDSSNEKTVTQAEKILLAGRSLQNLIDDILDFSKIESGKLQLIRERFALSELIETIALLMSSSASSKNIHLAISPNYKGDLILQGDRQRVEQILINLIGNAIKFTSSGYVEMRIDLSNEAEFPRLRFAIRDTGIGMSDTVLSRVLNPFEQGDSSITRRFGGSGLGLTITQEFLRLMGSELIIESQEFKGTKVSFELDIPIEQVPETPIRDSRVLIGCKNPFSRNALVSIADSISLQYEAGQTESYMLHQLLVSIEQNRPFELVIFDEEMSAKGINHLESFIRSELESKGVEWHGRFIAVLSPASISDIDEVNLDNVLIEPVSQMALRRLINPAPLEKTSESNRSRLHGLSLLVVDDNLFNRDAAREFLEAEGATIHEAENGLEAVKFIRGAEVPPDLIIMDVQMPIMDGIEATGKLRGMSRFRDLPIIGMSAGAYAEDIEKGLAAGMNAYITKPVDIEKAITTIVEVLKSGRPLVGSSETVVNKESDTLGDLSLFDMQLALTYWRSEDKVKSYLLTFIETYSEFFAQIIENPDLVTVESIHKIKGASSVLGMQDLTNALSHLEALLRSESSKSTLQVETLVGVWNSTLSRLKQILEH